MCSADAAHKDEGDAKSGNDQDDRGGWLVSGGRER
jgi:hypothetical protein